MRLSRSMMPQSFCFVPLLLGLVALPCLVAAQTSEAGKKVPRTSDGHPNLTGIWGAGFPGGAAPSQPGSKADKSIQVYLRIPGLDPNSPTVFKGLDTLTVEGRAAVPNKPSYRPEYLAKVQQLSDLQSKLDPAFFCKPPGVPRIGPPSQIVQVPGSIVFLYESQNSFRVIPTDGRPHRSDVDPSSLGDSVGHWEGDALVIEVTHLTDDTWLGSDGYFHSSDMRVVERLERNGDTITYSTTVEDPKVLARPWITTPRTLKLLTDPGDALIESPPCTEIDAQHMTTNEHH